MTVYKIIKCIIRKTVFRLLKEIMQGKIINRQLLIANFCSTLIVSPFGMI